MLRAMSTSEILVFLGAFLASAVEMVEALTIVLGVGVVARVAVAADRRRPRRSSLAVLVAALGPALRSFRSTTLRLVVGALLLAFGLQWLRKAILRSSGYKALHDEDEAFREEPRRRPRPGREQRAGMDWYAFTVSFKGVLLEGLEVVFIVITFGSARDIGLAAAGCGSRARARRRRRGARARAALARAREHDQVRRRPAAHDASASSGPPRAPASTGPATSRAARRARLLRPASFALVRALRRQRARLARGAGA